MGCSADIDDCSDFVVIEVVKPSSPGILGWECVIDPGGVIFTSLLRDGGGDDKGDESSFEPLILTK